jgi:hypothetical protein
VAHIDLAEVQVSRALRHGSGSLNIPHTAGSIALNSLATRLPRHILEQSLPRSTTMKPIGKPLVAGVGCQSTHPAPSTSSQQTIARALEPKTRQVNLVYRCWNFAGKVSLSLTVADPWRAFQAAILTRHVVAATGDRT